MPGRGGWAAIVLALAVLTAAALSGRATADEERTSGPLKGQWAFEIETASGRQPLSIAFRQDAQGGMLVAPGGLVEVEYRQSGAAFSVSAEIPETVALAGSGPTGTGQTLLLRGTQISERSATGTIMLIGDTPSASGELKYEVTPGTFTATRQ
jgi:hypothetical protein